MSDSNYAKVIKYLRQTYPNNIGIISLIFDSYVPYRNQHEDRFEEVKDRDMFIVVKLSQGYPTYKIARHLKMSKSLIYNRANKFASAFTAMKNEGRYELIASRTQDNIRITG